jgi:hypothetical protein
MSVVSHHQAGLVARLLGDLAALRTVPLEVLLTLNVPEPLPFQPDGFPFTLHVLRNAAPRGFGANHNAAFRGAGGEFFCVVNPDIRIAADPFPALLGCVRDPAVGVAAPLVRSPAGGVEDNARHFPTPWGIVHKALTRRMALDYEVSGAPIHPDWVAGMFMLFPRDVYGALGGFDERYFLYYEDVDLCARLVIGGWHAVLCPSAEVVHDARRASRRRLRYLRWHLSSMLRYFLSAPALRLALGAAKKRRHGAQ